MRSLAAAWLVGTLLTLGTACRRPMPQPTPPELPPVEPSAPAAR